MTLRDLITFVALLLVLLVAGRAWSQSPPTDILSILSSNDPTVQKVLGSDLDLDRAASDLRATPKQTDAETTRGHDANATLGIGALGGVAQPDVDYLPDAERVRAEGLIAKLTPRVGECYGEPMRDAASRYDSLTIRVVVDAAGDVTAVRVLHATRFGQRGTEACVTAALEKLQFPAGLTENQAQVGYRWTFDLGRSTAIRFAANETAKPAS